MGLIKINQSGVTRIVFLIGKYAIKMPRVKYGWRHFIQGVYSNLSEHECWNVSKSEWLCPVLFSFAGFILVMPRIKICKTDDELNNYPKEEGDDYKPINYGYYNGKIVCVDYPYHRIKPYKR